MIQQIRELEIFYAEHHDNCTNCGYKFNISDTTYLGYLENSDCAYLCDKCAHLLAKTIARYYFEKRLYEIPPMETRLWRYMDFSKYVHLLSTRALYFAPAIKFDDVFEGAKGIFKRKEIWDKHYFSFFVSAIKNPPEGYICDKTSKEIEQEAERLLDELNTHGEFARKNTYINCWHENNIESEAMWKLYSKDNTNAIAIQTTYESLYCSIDRDPRVLIGRVNYIDFTKEFAPYDASYWFKRKSFEHEKEVRAIILGREANENDGLLIPIDIDKLIEKIYITPLAPKWFFEVVSDVNDKYRISAPIMQSSMLEKPFY